MSWLTPTVRRWIYGVGIAVIPLAVVYGLIEQETQALWVTLLGALMGVIALPNTNDTETVEDAGEDSSYIPRHSADYPG